MRVTMSQPEASIAPSISKAFLMPSCAVGLGVPEQVGRELVDDQQHPAVRTAHADPRIEPECAAPDRAPQPPRRPGEQSR